MTAARTLPGQPKAATFGTLIGLLADTINPPWTSLQLYQADNGSPRYYLDLFGAPHMVPYAGDNSVEQLVVRVTLEFFARYVLGDTSALSTMTQAGNTSSSALVSGDQLPPPSSP